MNLTINKIIADNIVNYGMKQTRKFNYIVSMDTYLKDYDEKSKKYILENLEEIIDNIDTNEKVLDLIVDENNGVKDIDMIFYWEYLMTPFEKRICDNAKNLGIELDFGDVRNIASDLLDNDAFNENLTNKIKFYGNERELEL